LPGEIFSGENSILSKAYSPSVVRFFMMQAHYTSILDLSDEALQAAEKGYNRLMEAIGLLSSLPEGTKSDFDVPAWRQRCFDAMNDDFNTPILIAQLFEGVKIINLIKDGNQVITTGDLNLLKETFESFVYDVLGLEKSSSDAGESQKLDGVVQLLIDMRNTARADKDFAKSDQIRDALAELGIQLKDGKDGTTFSY
jgi:cysteinyl-tRNA synthetase